MQSYYIHCSKCSLVFTDIFQLYRHQKKDCNLEEFKNISADTYKYTCSKCLKIYSTYNGLYKHVRFVCGIEPQFECPVCKKLCSRKDNLMQHIKIHGQ